MGGYKTADLPSDPALVRGFAARFSKDDKTWLDDFSYRAKRSQNDVVNSALQLYRALAEERVVIELDPTGLDEPLRIELDDLIVTEPDAGPGEVLGCPVIVHEDATVPVFIAPRADA